VENNVTARTIPSFYSFFLSDDQSRFQAADEDD